MPSIGCDGKHGADAAAMVCELMQMCDLGMGRRPAQTLQAHARVSPRAPVSSRATKEPIFPMKICIKGDILAEMIMQESGRMVVERHRRLTSAERCDISLGSNS